jgi:hypothetical protein
MEWRRANSKVRQPGVSDRGCFLSVFAASNTRDRGVGP